ncbi:FAD/NAD(P)-binding domain-containing protein [Mollisia scopiformis]|uniref:FAD/NAD(P)-binding domain-containing protein n=1 Tax=Mollisia scopiformis TaxID=149040 RepID=A0A194X4C0_MOLSC|nr:FAD/NAD(P)-binding domain-containing protein [Mollisia scopiformis]KUJ15021.1 FAD/NAD(P)-binding domain-containing protein [Mollisia scopiformis]
MAPSFRVLVIGAGIVGLSTAISLKRKGHNVTILEKVANPRPIGGVINVPPNPARVLVEYGLYDLIAPKVDSHMKGIHFRRYDTAETICHMDAILVEEDYGAPNWRLARSDLQEALMTAAKAAGIEIRLGCPIDSIDQALPAAMLKNGEVIGADLIVGADGVNSVVREAVLPGEKITRLDHISAYYIDVERSLLSADQEVSPMLDENSIWLAPGRQLIATNFLTRDRFIMILSLDQLLGSEGDWTKQVPVSDVVERFKGFHPMAANVVKYVESDHCLVWRFPELPRIDTWVSKSGKVVIVGDAAHAMLPFAAQGAAMGIEDSACLAECLARATSTDDIPKLLDIFQNLRLPRVDSVRDKARGMHKMVHLEDGPAQQGRDKMLKARPFMAVPIGWDKKHIDDSPGDTHPLYDAYLYGFNSFDHTNRKLDEALKK